MRCLVTPIFDANANSITKLNIFSVSKCKSSMDIGFIVDSSGSLRTEFHKEKKFVNLFTESVGFGLSTSRVGVITFSSDAMISIKLSQYDSLDGFNQAVNALPMMGSTTRIDKALQLAQNQFFTSSNGARY